jgi:hypothetical protein
MNLIWAIADGFLNFLWLHGYDGIAVLFTCPSPPPPFTDDIIVVPSRLNNSHQDGKSGAKRAGREV